jgi:hypothetical protein
VALDHGLKMRCFLVFEGVLRTIVGPVGEANPADL